MVGYIQLNRHWAHSLLKSVQRKATTAKSRYNHISQSVKKAFLDEIVATVQMEEIPSQLIMNWDQTGLKIIPSYSWTMEERCACRVELTGVDGKRQITAVFCATMVGDFLPIQLIYHGKTQRCHPHYKFPSWNITHSPRHWSTEKRCVNMLSILLCHMWKAYVI